jgi:hypothetical protein
MAENERFEREEIYSRVMKAGKRTYYFDVRTTKAEEFYLTITESRRQNNADGSSFVKKHKLFLYKEDFEEFKESLEHVLEYIDKEQGEGGHRPMESGSRPSSSSSDDKSNEGFTQIEFEDL